MEPVGRDRELETVSWFLDGLESTRILLLAGEAGIGKTTLWRATVERARRCGYRILACTAAMAETQLSFTGLRDLLGEAFDDVAGELPSPQRQALAVTLLREEPAGGPPDPGSVGVAFVAALRGLAARDRLLLAADDVQWLDAPSAGAIAYALRRLDRERVAVLLSHRADAETSPPRVLDRLPRDVRTCTIGPLSVGALGRVLHDRLDVTFPRPTLHRLHDAAGGNPFYALELARALESRPLRADEPLPVPATLDALLRDRLAALPSATVEHLVLIAAAGNEAHGLIRAALGRDSWEHLQPALDAGILQSESTLPAFTHPLFAAVVYERAGIDARRRVHAALADAADDLETRARHLALARSGPDAEVAQALEVAAGQAGRRGAGEAVTELLDRAVAITPPDDRSARVRRLAAAAEALGASGEVERARALAREAVATAAPGHERAEALLALANVGYGDVRSCEAALAEAGDDYRSRARIQLVMAEARHANDAAGALRDARRAADDAAQAGDPTLESRTLCWVGRLEGLLNDGDPFVTLGRAAALQAGEADLRGGQMAEFHTAYVHLIRDELEHAREGFVHQLRRAEERGDLWQQVHVQGQLGRLEWRAGNWDEAAAYMQEAVETWSASGDDENRNTMLWAQALVPVHRGDLDVARDVFERATGPAPDATNRARDLWIQGHIALCEGEVAGALAKLEAAAALFERIGLREPGLRLFASDLIDARLAAERLADARTEAEMLLARGLELDRPRALAIGRRGIGLVTFAEGELDQALAALEQSLAEHERLPVPFERARTLLALGSVQRRARRRRAARETLQRGLAIFEDLGARLWAEKARAELARIGGRVAETELTTAEDRVARLVAEGKTNREVAAALVVSVHTVEAALTHVYRKLGVRSRTELTRRYTDRVATKD
jgi:DNA-binding CsgD family transcriptional regulator